MGKPHSSVYGIPISEIARICRVDLSTARRWKRGAICPPYTAAALLDGDLGAFGEYWRGWRVVGEEIRSPDGWRIRRDDALSVPLLLGQIDAMKVELAGIKRAAEELEDQPSPEEWQVEIA